MLQVFETTWSGLKSSMVSKNLQTRLQWLVEGDVYKIFLFDQPMNLATSIKITKPKNSDQFDFESNYKSNGNAILNLFDSDQSQVTKPKTTKTGWHFEPRCISWVTGSYNSLHNVKHTGADHGDATLKFWDTNRNEILRSSYASDGLYQAALTLNCRFTVMDWWPQVDIDIIGGVLFVKNVVAASAYGYIIGAPAIPAFLGGNVAFNTGGFDFSFFYQLGGAGQFKNDGRGVKTLVYDPIYRSNEMRFLLEHPAGYNAGIMIMYEEFKA